MRSEVKSTYNVAILRHFEGLSLVKEVDRGNRKADQRRLVGKGERGNTAVNPGPLDQSFHICIVSNAFLEY